ncbi:MAG: 30S ribosomal protein S20 [Candidatus Pacebacteria bacterium]|nr:30S ribosomal protein S20 [Candidatus Paceibacterota bacterium]
MPITSSAKKALRQSNRRREFNLRRLNAMKTAVKQVKKLKEDGKKEDALKNLSLAFKAIDKAAKRGVIKKGAADRKKSRLAKILNK